MNICLWSKPLRQHSILSDPGLRCNVNKLVSHVHTSLLTTSSFPSLESSLLTLVKGFFVVQHSEAWKSTYFKSAVLEIFSDQVLFGLWERDERNCAVLSPSEHQSVAGPNIVNSTSSFTLTQECILRRRKIIEQYSIMVYHQSLLCLVIILSVSAHSSPMIVDTSIRYQHNLKQNILNNVKWHCETGVNFSSRFSCFLYFVYFSNLEWNNFPC